MRKGADAVESYVSTGSELSIEVRHREVETLKQAEERGIGIRVFRGRRVGFAFGTEISKEGINDTLSRATAAAEYAAEDEYQRLPEPRGEYPAFSLLDDAIVSTPVEEKLALALRMEEAAFGFDGRVKVIESSAYHEDVSEAAIVNSLGIAAKCRAATCGLYISLAAQADGQSETGYALRYSRRYAELDPDELGREAASRAVRLLGARKAKTRSVPVVFDPYVAVDIIGLLAPALTAEAVQRGRSLFAGKAGQEVASSGVTLVDDGTYPGGVRTVPFDGEGVPTQRTVLIKDGVLQGYLHNTYTGAKEGRLSTGNAIRASFKSIPGVGPTNFYLEPGGVSPGELIKGVEEGLYVMEVMGMHTANPISGDFSVGASGVWIDKGVLARPVRGVVIAGNILKLLREIDAVADDLRFFGGRGAPTFRVASLKVSGD
ncbi:MAG TPA: TldD/PmbA family protein [Desulfotomaculum sp.]|nr:TldD/PmbA family protein [Desulfotomaculum sp.]